MKRNKTTAPHNSKRDTDVLCACFNVTRADVRDFMAQPGKTVDDLVVETEYGSKCTACLLDLDVTLTDLHAGGLSKPPPGIGSGKIAEVRSGTGGIDRIDSGFFICEDGTRSILQLANFNPLFEEGVYSVAHAYRLWIMTEDGKIFAQKTGEVKAHEHVEVDFSRIDGCPKRGWFLLSLLPLGPGYNGSLRPQILMIGDDWASSFHTQHHGFATNKGRRVAVGVKTTHGKTWNGLCVINGENGGGDAALRLSGPSYSAQYDFHLPGRGSRIINLDDVFEDLPEDAVLILSVDSKTLTRKYLLSKQPDGGFGADHFPSYP